ncbi:MAG TPA: hypothetical protein VF260_08450 [Bacilli bacterium]
MTVNPETLKQYVGRQVVISWYEDDGFAGKDGFHFDYINYSPEKIEFIKEDRVAAAIPIAKSAELVEMHIGFPRHYAVVDGSNRTEFYFP